MPTYRLEGYNSGGYHDFRDVEFDGKLEYVHYYEEQESDIPKTVSYIKVTYPDGSVTHEGNEFLQALLDEQSYIEDFLTVGIEELTDEMIARDKERIVDMWAVETTGAEEKRSYFQRLGRIVELFYKTRYLLTVPLLYLVGQWLEGPPTRVILLSDIFMVTTVLLMVYAAMFVKRENPEKYPVIFLMINILFALVYLYFLINYSVEVDRDFEVAKGILLGLFGIHFVYWFVSLFQNR